MKGWSILMNTKHMLDDILSFNKQFVLNKEYENYATNKTPSKKVVVLSCMDTRLTELLPRAMNLRNGDAKIIKNAGATVSHPYGSIIRSILVAIYEFNTDEVIVVGHKDCGMSTLDSDSMIDKMKKRGITEDTLSVLKHSGIDIKSWLHGFGSIHEAIEASVESIRNHPLIPKDVHVHGLLMDPNTGELEIVC